MRRIVICLAVILLASSHALAQLPPGYIGLFADIYPGPHCLTGTGGFTFYCFVAPPVTGMQCIELRTETSGNIAVFIPIYNPDTSHPILGGVPGDLAMCLNSCHNTADWVLAFSATVFVMDASPASITLGPFSGSPYMKILDCEGVETQAFKYTDLYINDYCYHIEIWPFLSYVTVQDERHIVATFTQPVAEFSAEQSDNYILFPKESPTDTMPVSAAEVYTRDWEVLLTLEQPLIQGVIYTLIAEDICRYDLLSCGPSYVFFQSTPIAVMLQGFDAKNGPEGVELSWELAGVDGDISFSVSRRGAMGGAFDELAYVEIERDGDTYTCIDTYAEPGGSYIYRVDYELGDETGVLFETEAVQTPAAPLTLHQNVPNPFNPSTEISYYLPVAADVLLEVYNVTGKRVATLERGRREKGPHVVMWQGVDDAGRGVASGIYFYRLRAGKEVISKKMVLLR